MFRKPAMKSRTLKPFVHHMVTTATIGMTQLGFLKTATGLPASNEMTGWRMPNCRSSIQAQISVTTETGRT
ncbi:hypothetical protein D3C71_1750260 [compost metagenome]